MHAWNSLLQSFRQSFLLKAKADERQAIAAAKARHAMAALILFLFIVFSFLIMFGVKAGLLARLGLRKIFPEVPALLRQRLRGTRSEGATGVPRAHTTANLRGAN
jgi:hypothetical protein